MNIVNKLTIRHMRQNSRRTMVTIIGVIISVAMVTSVSTLFVSFLDLMKRQEIAENGEWHVKYANVNKDQLEAIKKDDRTKKVILSHDVGYAYLKGSKNEDKPYLFIKEFNKEGFKTFPIVLSSGRLPKAANEVVLSEHIATNGGVNYKIGDELTLDVGDRTIKSNGIVQFDQQSPLTRDGTVTEILERQETKTYTVAGFIKRPTWEPTWAPGYTVIGYVDENIMGSDAQVDASVILKKVTHSIYNDSNAFAQKHGIKSVQFNKTLLHYYGVSDNEGLNQVLLWLSVIIIGIIMIGSVSLIYNAFAISVSERSRHLGMLSSVGATKRQKRNSVFFEGAVIGFISIPLGIVFGIGGISVTIWLINSIIQKALGMTENLRVTVTLYSILTTCAVSFLTIFISVLIPARRASKVSAIDAIRQTTDVKLTGKNVKTTKLVRWMFGFEAEIGLKNLKRNKRRYRATVFSLVISIILFLTVSYFTDSLKKSVELSQNQENYDIQVYKNGQLTPEDERIFNSIKELDNVTAASNVMILNAQSWIGKSSVADEFHKALFKDQFQNGKMSYMVNVYSLNEQNLKSYAQKIGVNDVNTLLNPNHKNGIVINTTSYREPGNGKYVETEAIHAKEGKSLELMVPNPEKEKKLGTLTIASLTDQLPMGIHTSGLGTLTVIVSEPVFEQIVKGQSDVDVNSFIYINSKDPLKTQDEIEKIKTSNMSFYNAYGHRQQSEQIIGLMSVFAYGFIGLITLISIANIFNTISTSVSLRKREFAMLKSVGMTPKGFNKMVNYESVFYGINSILYGLPISIGIMYLIHLAMMNSFSYDFELPWLQILYSLTAVFLIVGSAMLYSSTKVKKENIIEALKQESL